MAETCEGLMGMSGKLNHLNLKKAPAKSSAAEVLREELIAISYKNGKEIKVVELRRVCYQDAGKVYADSTIALKCITTEGKSAKNIFDRCYHS